MGLYAMFGVLQAVSRFLSLKPRLDRDPDLPFTPVLHLIYGLLDGTLVLPRFWSSPSQLGLETVLRSDVSFQLDAS